MINEIYREDDLLSIFGKYLVAHDYLILALSGNQQGRFWFQMDGFRKAPDIIAYRNDIILIGEAKLKSRELFKSTHGRKSDYQAMQYLLDNNCAKEQIINSIKSTISKINVGVKKTPPVQAIVVGGDSFSTLSEKITDSRILCFKVDKGTGTVSLEGTE